MKAVGKLIAAGAKFDLRSEDGNTALDLAKNGGYSGIEAVLRANGAK